MKAIDLIQGKEYLYQINSEKCIKVKYVDFDGTWYNFEKENGDITTVNERNLYRVVSVEIYEDMKGIYHKLGEVRSQIDTTQYDYIVDCGEYVLCKKGDEPKQIGRFCSIFTLDTYCKQNSIY